MKKYLSLFLILFILVPVFVNAENATFDVSIYIDKPELGEEPDMYVSVGDSEHYLSEDLAIKWYESSDNINYVEMTTDKFDYFKYYKFVIEDDLSKYVDEGWEISKYNLYTVDKNNNVSLMSRYSNVDSFIFNPFMKYYVYTHNLIGMKYVGPQKIEEGDYFRATLVAEEGYKLPSGFPYFVKVFVGGIDVSDSYNPINGDIYIEADKITGNIEISGLAEEIKIDMDSYGEEIDRNGVINYVDSDGTTSSEVIDNEIIWLREDINSESYWFGLDNSNGDFAIGSRFWVRILSKGTDEYEHYANLVDPSRIQYLDNNQTIMFVVGVTNVNGVEYTILDNNTNIYIQYLDTYNEDEINVVYINTNDDEIINTDVIKELNYPEGKDKFIVMKTKHFSPFVVYSENEIVNPATGDNIGLSLVIVSLSIMGLLTMGLYLKKEMNKS